MRNKYKIGLPVISFLLGFGLFLMSFNNSFAKGIMNTSSEDSLIIPLWHGNAPFFRNIGPEKILPSRGDGVTRITNVSNPTITVYPLKEERQIRSAVLICPGGGYTHLAYSLEGTDIAKWFKSIGILPVVLKYRVPDQKEGAFADVQRAMSLIRSNAKEWNIDPNKIGIIGFSAGGHLTARLITHYQKRIYEKVDEKDNVSIKPDFGIMIYPAYLVNKEDQLNKEVKIVDLPPPTFLTQTQDDPIGYRNSLFFFNALTEHHDPAEFHMFPHGGHGYGLRTPKSNPLSNWPELCQKWLKSIKMDQ